LVALGSYDYFEHQADMGIVGRGPTVEEAFAQAARALFDLMMDIERVRPLRKVSIRCQAHDRDELLVEWLNGLLAEADIRQLGFGKFHVEMLGRNELEGSAWGEPFDSRRHHPKTEVKAATYSMLFVGREGDEVEYVARCVVDL
jgi:SHS2 domain-containing protein